MAVSVVTQLSFIITLYVSIILISCGPHLRYEVQEANLKLSLLESHLEETVKDLDTKNIYLNETQNRIEELTFEIERLQYELSSLKNRIEELTFEIERLQYELSSLKDRSSHANQRVHRLEEEVQLLWNILRKNNFEIHSLEDKVQDADERSESVTSQVETMAAIVTERWIEIQQLEQALHIAQMKALQAKRVAMFTRCSFLKWVKNVFGEKSVIGFYLSQASHDLDTIFSAAKKYHLELQGFIKHAMEKNEHIASLANKELIFLLASAIFTFPIIGAWILLSA